MPSAFSAASSRRIDQNHCALYYSIGYLKEALLTGADRSGIHGSLQGHVGRIPGMMADWCSCEFETLINMLGLANRGLSSQEFHLG